MPRIALISDIHLAARRAEPRDPGRRNDLGAVLLARAVTRAVRMLEPDVVVLAGDLVDDGNAPDAPELLGRLKAVLDRWLACPLVVIPGNHDGDRGAFYEIFEDPAPFVEVAGLRIVPFVDAEEPAWNARRRPCDMDRFAAARADWAGPIVALQHVSLHPPGTSECPYNYTNADAVIDTMREAGVCLSLAGHYHAGMDVTGPDGIRYVAAPALCCDPFPFLFLDVQHDHICIERHELAMPRELGLVDAHIHTPLAYCSLDIPVEPALDCAEAFGLAGVGFSEHSDQLYFSKADHGGTRCLAQGVAAIRHEDDRVGQYLAMMAEAGVPPANVGMEVECDFQGRGIIKPGHRAKLGYMTGAIHATPDLRQAPAHFERACEQYMAQLSTFVETGIAVLAHPFRAFRRCRLPLPEHLFEPVAEMLRTHGVAAEINFNANEPPEAFFKLCVERGVRLALGSDSHILHTIGEFAPHLALLRRVGVSDPRDVAVDPRGSLLSR